MLHSERVKEWSHTYWRLMSSVVLFHAGVGWRLAKNIKCSMKCVEQTVCKVCAVCVKESFWFFSFQIIQTTYTRAENGWYEWWSRLWLRVDLMVSWVNGVYLGVCVRIEGDIVDFFQYSFPRSLLFSSIFPCSLSFPLSRSSESLLAVSPVAKRVN